MVRYILRRFAYSVLVLVASSLLLFYLVSYTRGESAGLYGTPTVAYQSYPEIVARRHLDRSLIVQYGYWAKDALTNRFGTTLADNQPILDSIARVMKNTLELILAAEAFAIVLALVIGVFSALRQYSPLDYAATTASFVGLSMPVFWFALILQALMVAIYDSTGHLLFPIANLNSVDSGSGFHFWVDRAHHMALPIFVLAIGSIALYSRYIRASVLEVMNSDYVRTARAKGLVERRVVIAHTLRTALVPLVTVVAVNLGALFGGAIVVETVFSLDGMGLYFINALGSGDAYRIMAWLMITATAVIVFNLIADILYAVLDPRVRLD